MKHQKKVSITFIIVCLFILELVFGLNGKWLVLGGISIRHWLFAAVLILTYIKALWFFLRAWRRKRQEGMSCGSIFKSELASFTKFDWLLLAFLVLHGIWIIWIPYTQRHINPAALSTALSSGLSISIMALYFPAIYLLRNGQVRWKQYRNVVQGCLVAICAWHVALYILERIQWEQDHTYYFMERVFDWWEQFVQGKCEFPMILMPKYAVRIIYGCNILIPMAFYFILGQKRKRYILWILLGITALFTTGTRALIVGTVAGICAFLLLDCIIHKWKKETVKKLAGKAVVVLLFAVAIDSVVFQGMNITRLSATFSASEEVLAQGQAQSLEWSSSEYSVENEFRGTANSNTTRLLQVKELLGKFMERPWLGHGFTIINYDMQGLAYIVKVGIAGVLLWGIFLAALLYRVARLEKMERGGALPAIYLIVAVLADVMLQAMFGSITMAMAVFLFLDLAYKEISNTKETG